MVPVLGGVGAAGVEEPVDQHGPLDGGGGAHHVEGHGGEAVLLQEGHQEPDADEDHRVDVLEHWNKGRDIEI